MHNQQSINQIIYSNVRIFYAIAKESFDEMKAEEKKHMRPKANGEPGNIITIDLDQKGFKAALKTIVFCGVYFDAFLHLLIGKRFGSKECKNTDKCTYEDKLAILGCQDDKLFDACEYLRKVRNKIVHEKAYFDNKRIKIAQKEAEKAIQSLDSICQFLSIELADS